jgi:hypothetical protein
VEFSGTASKLGVVGEKSLLVNFPKPCGPGLQYKDYTLW